MIPLKDILPRRSMPVVVILIIAANAGVWVLELLQGGQLNDFVMTWGFTPLRIMTSENPQKWLTPLSSMFMHGSWLHIIGNMWFLWIFGDNVEDAFGHAGFVLFYLVCGLGATALQFLISMNSPLPMVGASGAISGILGAYACFYPRARIVALVPIFVFIRFFELPAILFIVLWFLLQLMSGCVSVGMGTAGTGGVAFWAHVGGFVAGWLIALVWKVILRSRGKEICTVTDNMFTFRKRQGW
jgi:membrane associated rhomboid family serine protease